MKTVTLIFTFCLLSHHTYIQNNIEKTWLLFTQDEQEKKDLEPITEETARQMLTEWNCTESQIRFFALINGNLKKIEPNPTCLDEEEKFDQSQAALKNMIKFLEKE